MKTNDIQKLNLTPAAAAILAPLPLVEIGRGKNGNTLFSGVVLLTPQLAKSLLTLSEGNRDLKPARLATLAEDTILGHFALNGEPMIIDRDGVFREGHHRAETTVETGVAIETVLTVGISKEAAETIDHGAPRSEVDTRKMLGIPGASNTHVGTLAAIAVRYMGMGGLMLRTRHFRAVETEFAAELAMLTPEFKGGKGTYFNQAPVRAALVVAARKYPFEAVEFARAYFNQEYDRPQDPAKALWNMVVTKKGKIGRQSLFGKTLYAILQRVQGQGIDCTLEAKYAYQHFNAPVPSYLARKSPAKKATEEEVAASEEGRVEAQQEYV